MKIDTKDITFNLTNYGDNDYSIKCFLSMPEQNKRKLLGYINFKIKSNNKAWILRISVDEDRRRLGIGSSLLSEMENFLNQENDKRRENREPLIKIIEGEFYPLGISEKNLRDFYEANGYYVPNKTRTWDNYDKTWTLSKYVSNDAQNVKEK